MSLNDSPSASPLAATDASAGQVERIVSIPMELLGDVEVEVTVEIGRRKTAIGSLLTLAPGQTFELGKAAGEPLDIYVNGKLLGRGEAIVVGSNYGVRITELVKPGTLKGT